MSANATYRSPGRPAGERVAVGVADDHDLGRAGVGDLIQEVRECGPAADRVELLGDVARPAGDPGAQARRLHHDLDDAAAGHGMAGGVG